MIDTNKYKGCQTDRPLVLYKGQLHPTVFMDVDGSGEIVPTLDKPIKLDAFVLEEGPKHYLHLLTDAQLLLAEVKRLQNIIDGIVIHLSEITTYSFGDDNPGDENAQWMHWRNTRQEVLDIIASDGIEEVNWT